jgi:hypothetical protein
VQGIPASAAASAAMAAGLQTKMDAAEQAFRYAFAVFGCADDEAGSNATLVSAFANVACKRVMACAGYAEVVSPISGLIRKRSSAALIGPRIKKAPVSEDLARVRSGPLSGVNALYHDEQATPVLDAARFASLRTFIGQPGYYITNGRLMSPAGSDFKYVQHRRVMDLACTVARAALVKYLSDSIRLDPQTGFILETEARAIEADVGGQLETRSGRARLQRLHRREAGPGHRLHRDDAGHHPGPAVRLPQADHRRHRLPQPGPPAQGGLAGARAASP